ncbi:uncharacterized protein (TIGR00369 family) [Rhodovulum imhoffii]|uniref:Uncharacterized protein (TIGR00369 family) n=1 Tax=Rhodovulum imhoffii TaxID=365340 RepID=A0A2T5BQZ8_9RHOB|nr:PaaI family thioesterase [Rhodovulum imhoffii]MBK5932567.1 phenylacetic acid degradation protein [Rhodovulum imhoffii]PTN01650.1 uncharacterized protein (TIGR00369 family) [Rhodovulum imhoffii]
MTFEPKTPAFAERVRANFALQGMMTTLGAELTGIEPGRVCVTAPVAPHTTQQNGYGHAALSFALGDTAGGYSAMTLLPEGWDVLTSEIKIHLLAPARGDRLTARAEVIKPGRRLIIVRAEVFALENGHSTHSATLLGTMVPVETGR